MGRSRQEILADYAKACENTEMRLSPGFTRVYEYANTDERKALREEYVRTLDDEKQIAIKLMSKLKGRYSEEVYYEIDGIEDNWDAYLHKKYLEIAKNMFKVAMDKGVMADDLFDVIDGIVECLA